MGKGKARNRVAGAWISIVKHRHSHEKRRIGNSIAPASNGKVKRCRVMQSQSGDLPGIASELQGNGIAGLGDDLLRQGIER